MIKIQDCKMKIQDCKMKIQDWEKRVASRFPFEKVVNIEELRFFMDRAFPPNCIFSITGLTEGYIDDDEFYAAYVFDERIISKRDMFVHRSLEWTTTIVIVAVDKDMILYNYHVLGLNCFDEKNENELRAFFHVIDPRYTV